MNAIVTTPATIRGRAAHPPEIFMSIRIYAVKDGDSYGNYPYTLVTRSIP